MSDTWLWLTRCLWRGHRRRLVSINMGESMPIYVTGMFCEVCGR